MIWGEILTGVKNIGALGLVALSLIIIWYFYQQMQKTVVILTEQITKLAAEIESMQISKEQFGQVLDMYENAMDKITTTQEKIAITLNVLTDQVKDSYKLMQDVRLDNLKNTLGREVRKHD